MIDDFVDETIIPFQWECIEDTEMSASTRAKVFGGWLVQCTSVHLIDKKPIVKEMMVFVPDPKHEWKVK